jgi:3-hydroxyisobutyrate dehydrogenase-like beta-hydroxyacid dehydrogenase
MTVSTIGIVHPGEMGASLGAVLVRRGFEVRWASDGRRAATRLRAEEAGLIDVGTGAELAAGCDLIISICPPDAALSVAQEMKGFTGIYLDANAIAPATASAVAALIEGAGGSYVDGGITSTPPTATQSTHLYLSGPRAGEVAGLFADTWFDARVISDDPVAASAMKICYAAWSKGSAALMLDVLALARTQGISAELVADWDETSPGLQAQRLRAGHSAASKGWRWEGEMLEIAATFRSAGLPDGFHLAAAQIFGRPTRDENAPRDEHTLDAVVEALINHDTA